ncbi:MULTISPECIES: protease inhibitor I42 family protein [unclassified Kitasatospora]|uniref:protease inhibitor I42 family protein n=1 Tax=unclassified Kitasatospora TaxID=2633591 RepID=UPI0033C2C568
MRWRRILIAAVALLAVAGVVGAVVVHRMTTGKLDHGTVFAQASGELAVKPGELFSVEVSAHRVTGQVWTVADPAPGSAPDPAAPQAPDSAAVRSVGDEYVKDFGLKDLVGATGSAGSGGRYYFVFRAGPNPGRATITLRNPNRAARPGGSDQDERQFTVDVR